MQPCSDAGVWQMCSGGGVRQIVLWCRSLAGCAPAREFGRLCSGGGVR